MEFTSNLTSYWGDQRLFQQIDFFPQIILEL